MEGFETVWCARCHWRSVWDLAGTAARMRAGSSRSVFLRPVNHLRRRKVLVDGCEQVFLRSPEPRQYLCGRSRRDGARRAAVRIVTINIGQACSGGALSRPVAGSQAEAHGGNHQVGRRMASKRNHHRLPGLGAGRRPLRSSTVLRLRRVATVFGSRPSWRLGHPAVFAISGLLLGRPGHGATATKPRRARFHFMERTEALRHGGQTARLVRGRTAAGLPGR